MNPVFSSLPNEILIECFLFVSLKELGILSKQIQKSANDKLIWRKWANHLNITPSSLEHPKKRLKKIILQNSHASEKWCFHLIDSPSRQNAPRIKFFPLVNCTEIRSVETSRKAAHQLVDKKVDIQKQ